MANDMRGASVSGREDLVGVGYVGFGVVGGGRGWVAHAGGRHLGGNQKSSRRGSVLANEKRRASVSSRGILVGVGEVQLSAMEVVIGPVCRRGLSLLTWLHPLPCPFPIPLPLSNPPSNTHSLLLNPFRLVGDWPWVSALGCG